MKKINKSFFTIAAVIVGTFALFAFIAVSGAKDVSLESEIMACSSMDEVRSLYETHKKEVDGDESLLNAMRERLTAMKPGKSEINEIYKWLKAPSEDINIIIVPDLSRRLTEESQNPDQVRTDTMLLNYIYALFEERVKLKMNTADRLVVDVTDNSQACGNFREVADELYFDLSEISGKSNRFYFEKRAGDFKRGIEKLYSAALENPLGADYWLYFKRNLKRHVRERDLFHNFRNIVIIVTDGYLEAERKLYTGSSEERMLIISKLKNGEKLEEALAEANLSIEPIEADMSGIEVLILEVSERRGFEGYDYEILKELWRGWLKEMGVENAESDFFMQSNDAVALTKDAIKKFILQ